MTQPASPNLPKDPPQSTTPDATPAPKVDDKLARFMALMDKELGR